MPRQNDLASSEGAGDAIGNSAGLVIFPDSGVKADDVSLNVFPAFGPGRPPGGLVPKDVPSGASHGWVFPNSDSGRSHASASRRNGSKRSGYPGKSLVESVVTQQVVCGGEEIEGAGTPPKSVLFDRLLGRAVSSATVNNGGSSSAMTEGANHRSGSLLAPEASRFSLGSHALGSGMSATAAAGAGSRDPKAANITGRNTPQGSGLLSHERRHSNGKKDASHGSNRASGMSSMPKVSAHVAGTCGTRRASGDVRSDVGGVTPTPTSPHQLPGMFGEDDDDIDRENGDILGTPIDLDTLMQLLHEYSPSLVVSAMPPKPTSYLEIPCASQQPLVLHLCRLWIQAGFTDRDWDLALRVFEAELHKQRQTKSAGVSGESLTNQNRWTLETFSMWLLGRGRLLRECGQWFQAFDFDQDKMIGIADFLQGVAVAGASRIVTPNTLCGFCMALALFRLLDLERRENLDARDLESMLKDAQVVLGTDFPLSLAQVAEQATDFEFFRKLLLPRLQGASAFRLLVLD